LKIINGFHLKNVRGDILGGITAAVVALPLALAFGNAALGPGGAIYGLYGAVVVGFLAALFGGTPAQVSGPTGPMSVTVAGVVAGLAAVGVPRDLSAGQILPLVMAAVVIGGLLQILFGILKLGKYITLVPYSVVSGFMSGIGVIIIALQIGPLLGISTRGGVVESLSTVFSNFQPNGAAIGVAIMTLGIVFLTPRKISQWVPSPLLALLIVTPISIVIFGDEMKNKEKKLKVFLKNKMYNHPKVKTMNFKAKKIVSDLFDLYIDEPYLLPTGWRNFKNENEKYVNVSDYISGMTDNYAINIHKKYFDLYSH